MGRGVGSGGGMIMIYFPNVCGYPGSIVSVADAFVRREKLEELEE